MTLESLVPVFGRGRHPARPSEYDPFRDLQLEMNRLFDDVFSGAPVLHRADRSALAGAFMPRVDVSETDNEIKISAELPGMEEKDVAVEVDGDSLLIRGEKREEKEEKIRNWHCREQSYGTFERYIPLPASVEGNSAKATFKKGVLSVTVPKKASEQNKRKAIKIDAA